MQMSNNGINIATNGRSGGSSSSSSNVSAHINLKTKSAIDGKTQSQSTTTTTTTAGTTIHNKTLPDKLKALTTNNGAIQKRVVQLNEGNKTANAIATHRRDSSNLLQKDVRKFQYGRPQTTTYASKESGEREHGLLVYYEKKLISASLDALIMHMVPTHDYYPERNYTFAFLLCARLFIRPHELLARISQAWDRQQQSEDVVDEAHFLPQPTVNSASPLVQRKIPTISSNQSELEPKQSARTAMQKSAQNCIRLLAEWIETFPYDFRDERLMQQVRILARKCVYIDNSLGKQVSRILQLLVGRLTALERYEEFLQTLQNTAATTNDLKSNEHTQQNQTVFGTSASASYTVEPHKSLSSGSGSATNSNSNSGSSVGTAISANHQTDEIISIMDICASCAQLAHQLTAIELERLSHIGPEEFVQAFAKEYQHSVTTTAGVSEKAASTNNSNTSLNDMKKTRNLESYVEWFNRLSYLTACEIVKFAKKKQRVRVIEFWIETARECFNIGNFNSLMAIIAGLNLAPISRLKKTWAKVQSAKFSVLEHQMDPTSNFNSYRSTLKAAMWRCEGATEERERIIIPFFSLFVKDLYFLNEGCSNRLPNNHINFEKCSQLAKQINEFNEWKKVTCPFEKAPNVIAYLQRCPILNENMLTLASFECEQPDNTEEKDRYKTVKAETKQQLLQQFQGD